MNLFNKVSVAFLLMACGTQLWAAEPKQKVREINHQAIVEYLNTFNSFEEMFQNYLAMGLVTNQDAAEIKDFLKTKGLDLSAKPTRLKLEENKFVNGNIGWIAEKNGTYKTLEGRILKFSADAKMSEVFIKMFQALENKRASLENLFFIDKAYAGNVVLDTASASGGFVVEYAARTFGSVYLTVGSALATAVGGVIELVGLPYRKFYAEGMVECDRDGDYIITTGFTKAHFAYTDSRKKSCQFADKHDHMVATLSNGLCEWNYRGIQYFEQVIEMKAEKSKISEKKLKEIFKPNSIRSCRDEKDAKIVEKRIKSEVGSFLSEIPQKVLPSTKSERNVIQ